MEMIDFWCHLDGDTSKKAVQIKIPAECCGQKNVIAGNRDLPDGADCFSSYCRAHFADYLVIWKNWLKIKDHLSKKRKRCRQCHR